MKNKTLNLVFGIEILLFGLIVAGILPRQISLYLAGGLVAYAALASLENGVILFVRSIPLFLALPLTENFDNFNTWRILAVILFLKWFGTKFSILNPAKDPRCPAGPFSGFKFSFNFSIFKFSNKFKAHTKLLILLLLLAILSVIPAEDSIAAIKRVIYFLNLFLIGFVIYDKSQDKGFAKRIISNSLIPVFIAAAVGYIQLFSTYLFDIYQFMRIWGEGIQCRQFGEVWCNIAVWMGNTWFAYYGEQLSLRIFSLFPDSHSFPQFVLLGMPAAFAFIKKRSIKIPAIALLFLIVILSGTRGIWAAGAGTAILALGLMFWMRKTIAEIRLRKIFKNTAIYLILFFALFSAAFPIFSSPQFLVGKGDSDILKKRIKSIIDFGETSNQQRLEIWKKSFDSIKQKPFLGVGIGNFPVVLEQDIKLAKAGSSAHNLYLHIAAEMGIFALMASIWLFWILFKKIYKNFTSEEDNFLTLYFSAALLFIPWILIYSLTDAALFDERAFLIFIINAGLLLGMSPVRSRGHVPRPASFGIKKSPNV